MAKKTIFLILFLYSIGLGSPYNGDFEIYDCNLRPVGWDWYNNAVCTDLMVPDTSSGGLPWYWKLPGIEVREPLLCPPDINIPCDYTKTIYELRPFRNDRFLTLTTSSNMEITSSAWRKVSVHPGRVIKGVYFFGTCDYVPYEDWITILLTPVEGQLGTPEIEVMRQSVLDIDSYSSLGGWKRWQYNFTPAQTGRYYLTFQASDYEDAIYSSQMAVDSVALCQNDTGDADLNCDCTVDFQDYAILAADWDIECTYPTYDCLLGTDIDNNGSVGMGDLIEMAKYWLAGSPLIEPARIDIEENGVDLTDFAFFASNYGQANAACDYDENGTVDQADLNCFKADYLK